MIDLYISLISVQKKSSIPHSSFPHTNSLSFRSAVVPVCVCSQKGFILPISKRADNFDCVFTPCHDTPNKINVRFGMADWP